jgi:hypothetical protein
LRSTKGKRESPRPGFLHDSGGYDLIVRVGEVAKILGEHDVIEPATR